MQKIKTFIKKEIVFIISAMCAILTMFIVPPNEAYIEYIDFRVLCLLFCLMAVVAGFKSVGAFKWLTYKLLSKIKNGKVLSTVLVMLPFFCSMLVTNDVALIVFVPFTIALLIQLGFSKSIIPVIVMQTVAANLGSMATPVGNPQNLFLYSAFDLSVAEFFSAVLPLTAVSFVMVLSISIGVIPGKLPEFSHKKENIESIKILIIYALLFVLCLLTVFRVVPYILTMIIVAFALFLFNRNLFKEIDYMLLLTFVCFFIISGNLGNIEAVRSFLSELLQKSTLLTSVGASQVISNVPAAVLLSGFTDDWKSLLQGVNIGGLGTPVASLASLITLKLYFKNENANVLKFLGWFAAVNVLGLIILCAFTYLT